MFNSSLTNHIPLKPNDDGEYEVAKGLSSAIFRAVLVRHCHPHTCITVVLWLSCDQEYYKTGVLTCPSSESIQDVKDACDYLLISFDESTIKTNNLSEYTSSSPHCFSVSIPSTITCYLRGLLPRAVQWRSSCSVWGVPEGLYTASDGPMCQGQSPLRYLVDLTLVFGTERRKGVSCCCSHGGWHHWLGQWVPTISGGGAHPTWVAPVISDLHCCVLLGVHSNDLCRFFKYFENRDIAKDVMREKGLKKIRIGVEG